MIHNEAPFMPGHESIAHTQLRKQLIEAVSEEVQTLDLLDKDFKSTIINMYKVLKNNNN